MRKSGTGLNDRHKLRRQSAYQRGSQRDSSPHYVLLYSDDDFSEDENIPLQTRTHAHPPRKVEVIKIQLQPEDTLQGLALRYHCTISELKRINRIHKDNEIFAFPSLKVPVQPFSLLTETSKNIQGNETDIAREDTTAEKEDKIVQLVTNPSAVLPHGSEINNIILNSVIEPISPTNDNEEDTCTLLSPSERQDNLETNIHNSLSCSGADWGWNWRQILGIFLFFVIVLPIMFLFQKNRSVTVHGKS